MNLIQTANSIYHAIKNDGQACARIRKEFADLSLSIATDPSATAVVTSATVNGQSFSSTSLMNNGQRHALLRYVVACLDSKAPLSSTRVTTF